MPKMPYDQAFPAAAGVAGGYRGFHRGYRRRHRRPGSCGRAAPARHRGRGLRAGGASSHAWAPASSRARTPCGCIVGWASRTGCGRSHSARVSSLNRDGISGKVTNDHPLGERGRGALQHALSDAPSRRPARSAGVDRARRTACTWAKGSPASMREGCAPRSASPTAPRSRPPPSSAPTACFPHPRICGRARSSRASSGAWPTARRFRPNYWAASRSDRRA